MSQASSSAFIRLFQELPICASLDEDEIKALVDLSVQKLYGANEIIFHEGDPGLEAYIVVRGNVDILIKGRELPIARIPSGQIFGELAFLDGEPRTASARTAEPCILLSLARESFDTLCTMSPRLGMIVMYNIAIDLAGKLRYANRQTAGESAVA